MRPEGLKIEFEGRERGWSTSGGAVRPLPPARGKGQHCELLQWVIVHLVMLSMSFLLCEIKFTVRKS